MNAHASLRLLALAVLVAAFGAAAPPALAQTADDALRFTNRVPATGARLIGMGGAGVAGLADPGALFVNPAGLGYFRTSMVSGALNTTFATDEAFVPVYDGLTEADASATRLGNLAYAYKLPTRQGSFVIGAALNQIGSYDRELAFAGFNNQSSITSTFLPFENDYIIDDNNDFEFIGPFRDFLEAGFLGGAIEYYPEFLEDDDPNNDYPFLEAVAPGTTIEQRGSVFEEGRLNEFSIGGAAEAVEGLMVGVSVNLTYGQYDLLNIFEEDDVNNENGPDEYTVIGDNGLLEGFSFFEYRQTLETDLVGINLRGGLSGQVTEALRLGLTLETPTLYSVDETFTTRLETLFDRGGSLVYGNRADDVFGNGEFEYEITTPWRLSAGMGYAADAFTVNADLEFIDWSQLELDADVDRAFFADLNREIAETYNAVVNARVGAEYRVDAFALRGGFAYQPDPLDEAVRATRADGSELDRSRAFVSLGFGYRFSDQFQFDIGLMQERFEDTYSAYPEDPDNVLLVDEDIVRNHIVAGVKFFF